MLTAVREAGKPVYRLDLHPPGDDATVLFDVRDDARRRRRVAATRFSISAISAGLHN